MGSLSLLFMGKKFHPSHKWNDGEGLLQDPKTHAPHSKMDFKGGMAYATLLHFMDQRSQRSLSSLGGAPFIWQEDVDGIYPRFLRWLPKYRLSTPSKRSLEVWCTVIDNLIVANISLNPWLGCEEYVECNGL
ncbi:uncharacterized protein LOC112003681 isoform X2 [Quercus suber]|uniref:uncharacterized protein LOC112003681 isoform X2 n=1 Tax=Quercus suber TaxID=58331 RepID=UPI0032E04930